MARGPKPVSKEELAEIWTNRHKQGMAEFQVKGFSEEEESNREEIEQMFQYVWKSGYEYVHTLKVVPLDCGRDPFYVHVDSLNGE